MRKRDARTVALAQEKNPPVYESRALSLSVETLDILAQLLLKDLTGDGFGDGTILDETELQLEDLVTSEAAEEEGLEGCSCDGVVGADNKGERTLCEVTTNADDCSVLDVGGLKKAILDLCGCNLPAIDFDEILGAVYEIDLGVADVANVASVEPAICVESVSGGFVVAQVASHHVRALDVECADCSTVIQC